MERRHLMRSAFIISILFFRIGYMNFTAESDPISDQFQSASIQTGADKIVPKTEVPLRGIDCEYYYFENWHYPNPLALELDMIMAIWEQIEALPSEEEPEKSPPTAKQPWICVGPYGQNVKGSPGTLYSGRILDLELNNNGFISRIASASGGLWEYDNGNYIPLSDQLWSLAVGSFSSMPGNSNTIMLGTGELTGRTGVGLYRTTDNGTNWTRIPLFPESRFFTRIRFHRQNESIVHVCTERGYYHSEDQGLNFIRKLDGAISDITMSYENAYVMYCGKFFDGIHKSTDAGLSWSKLNSPDLPDSNIGRIAVSAYSNYTVYSAIAKADDNTMWGVFRSTDGGMSWADISPPADYMRGQGSYDNVIGVSPIDSLIVLIGGIDFYRSSDGGSSWQRISKPEVHADHHAITWSEDGTKVWEGNDGGLTYSTDLGITWSTAYNNLPITQYYHLDVGKSSSAFVFGGSQDNGISGTTDGGAVWNHTEGGDGGGFSIHPTSPQYMFNTVGVYSGAGANWAFERHRSIDFGQNWDRINNGIDPSTEWFPEIRNDGVSPTTLYANSGQHIYQSRDLGNNWIKFNQDTFITQRSRNFSLFHRAGEDTVIYVCLSPPDSPNLSGRQLMVYDKGTWEERSNGLPSSLKVNNVAPHPYNSNIAYALMSGTSPGERIYRTYDRGRSWENATGNLPDVPVNDLVPHPSEEQIIYLGTEMGCYKSNDFGATWIRWNWGMPQANVMTEMTYIDSTAINGKFYIYAASYGRSIWKRDISSEDPVNVMELADNEPNYLLEQNYPNPFNNNTIIEFYLPRTENIKLIVYSITGEVIKRLIDSETDRGYHKAEFNAANLASGVYIYELTAGKYSRTRKMIVLK